MLLRLMQSVRTWFYYEYCGRVYLAYSGVGIRDLEVRLTLIHDVAFICPTEVDLKSVVIDYCTTTTSVHHSFWGGTNWNFIYVLPNIYARNYL